MLNSRILATLVRYLDEGAIQIGEIVIANGPAGSFRLRHYADLGEAHLERFTGPATARQLATYDGAGAFRPLRTAPNLRRGWDLELQDVTQLRAALDHFYPAMLGVLANHGDGSLAPVPLQETLGRQSGMYAVTRKLTADQAQTLVGDFCKSDGGCLKTILWKISPGTPITTLPDGKFDPSFNQTGAPGQAIPLLCHEACNLLVAAARSCVKRATQPPEQA